MRRNDYIEIELDLDEDILFEAMLAAHREDMTLNDWLNSVLQDFMDAQKDLEALPRTSFFIESKGEE